MDTINTLAPTNTSTDALVHMHTQPQLSHKQILLIQTQRPVVYTQKKQLRAINTLARIGWTHTSTHTYGCTHKRLILQLLGSRGTECPQQLWIPPNVRTGEGQRKGRKDRWGLEDWRRWPAWWIPCHKIKIVTCVGGVTPMNILNLKSAQSRLTNLIFSNIVIGIWDNASS